MLEKGGAKVLPVIPQLIIPIKSKSIYYLFIYELMILIFSKFSRFEYKRHGNHLNMFEDLIGSRYLLRHHW
jgi:hypothetical protein